MKDFLFRFYKKHRFLALPVVLIAVLVQLFAINTTLYKQINNMIIKNPPVLFSNKLFVPVLKKTVLGESTFKNSFSAEAFVVMDSDSKVLLFAKNENLRFSLASTTKIMTALVGMDYFKMDDILQVFEESVEGVNAGFKKGQRFLFRDILYAMLLPSGNDAAASIAQNYPGGEVEFVKKMNEKAKKFFLENTHFSDSTGLDDTLDFTTAYDLAKLSSFALKNPVFADIVSTKHKIITPLSGDDSLSLFNLNKLLGKEGITGVKTGFTEEARGVLVTSKKEGEHTIVIVVMHSSDRFADTNYLLRLILGSVVNKPIYFPSL